MNNLLLEGRYDNVTTQLSREIVIAAKQGKRRLKTRIVLFKRTYVDVSVYFHYLKSPDNTDLNAVWEPDTLEQVYGATYLNPKEVRKEYKNKRIILHVDIPKDEDRRLASMSTLIPELKNIIRHEIEHITQHKFKDRERGGFFSEKRRYPQDIEYWEYLIEPYEIEAYVRGLYKKAKTLKQPLNVVLGAWWDYLTSIELHPDEIQTIKKAWTDYAKQHLPQTPLRQYGYIDEPEGIVESQRVMGFKLKGSGPNVNCIIRFEAPDSGNLKFKIRDILDYMDVSYNSVEGGGGKLNSYGLDLNLYDEKEAQAIIDDLTIKLMLKGDRIKDATYSIREPKPVMAEAVEVEEDEEEYDEMGGFNVGDEVKMSEEYKSKMMVNSAEHIQEFGDLVGVVEGLVDYNNVEPGHPNHHPHMMGPELEVRWRIPGYQHGLRYSYMPEDLVPVINYSDFYNPEYFTESVLFEAKKDTLKSKWNAVPDDVFDKIITADPSTTKKYSEWMLNAVINGGYNVDTVINTVQKFDQVVGRINHDFLRKGIDAFESKLGIDLPTNDIDVIFRSPKDINSYAGPGILDSILDQIQSKKTKREEKMVGADKIYEDDNFTVILPKTREASCHYGATTKWCTAAKSSNQFDNYSLRGTLYYILFKAKNVLDAERIQKPVWQARLPKFEKIARYIHNGLPYGAHGEFYNTEDSQIGEEEILNQFFGVTWNKDSFGDFTTNVPKGTKPIYDSWHKLMIAIDTHYAKNGMNKPNTGGDSDWNDDIDDWDDYEEEGDFDDTMGPNSG